MTGPQRASPRTFDFPLPFDPLRLLYGVRQRWLWFLILPLLLGSLGLFLGGLKTEDRYSVSLQLIKSEVPATLQTSKEGQAFQPRELSDDTLLSTTYSTEVLRRTAERLEPKRSAGEIKSMVEIAKQRNTSLFYLTAHSRISAEDAVSVVSAWADEVIRFTDNLQREEARQMKAFIAEQMEGIEVQLAEMNEQILEFATENNFVDVDKQTESALSVLENTRAEMANARIELETKSVQIERYREELRAQSPLEADLKKKREELTSLRGRYTDKNPLVKEKLYEIEHIESTLEESATKGREDLKEFTGSDLGNNLYLEILALENERSQLRNLVRDLEARLEEQRAEVAGLPAKALRLSELKSRRAQLIDAQALLENRWKEASFYETKAPGYWRVFQEPSVDEVSHSSQNVKAFFLGFAGFSGGLVIALVAALFWEMLQPGLRTPLEAAIACSTLPIFDFVTETDARRSRLSKLCFRNDETSTNDRSLRAFWLSHAIGSGGRERKRFLFIPTSCHENEEMFWQALLNVVAADGKKVDFIDLVAEGEIPMDGLEAHPVVRQYGQVVGDTPMDADCFLFLRLAKTPSVNEARELASMEAYYLMNSPSIADREETRHRSEVLRNLLGPAHGLLLIDYPSINTLPRFIKWLELSILNRRAARTADA